MTYEKLLLKAYAIEVLGEVIYRSAATHAKTTDSAQKWSTLAELEKQTGQLVRQELLRLNIKARSAIASGHLGRVLGWCAAHLPWKMTIWGMLKVTRHATHQWLHLQRLHATRNPELMQALVDHELAQESFAIHEQNGRSQMALEAIKSQLRGKV